MLQGAANTFVQVPATRLRANLNAGMLPGVLTAQLRPGRRRCAAAGRRAQPLGAGLRHRHRARRRQRRQDHANRQRHHHRRRPCHRRRLAPGRRAGLHQQPQQHRRARRQRQGRQLQPDDLRRQGLRPRLGQAQLSAPHGLHLARHVDPSQHRRRRPPQTLEASYRGNTAQVFTELATPSRSPSASRWSRSSALASSLHTRAFTESGGDAALRGDSNRNNVATTTLGLHARSASKAPARAPGAWHAGLASRLRRRQPGQHAVLVQGGGSFTANGSGGPRRGPGRSWA